MPVPTQPVVLKYSGLTHVIAGLAEPGSSVAIYSGTTQFGPSVVAAGDGAFAVELGDLVPDTEYEFVAIASNGDGDSAPSAALNVNDRPGSVGEWISGAGSDYDLTGTDMNDSFGFKTAGDLTMRGAGGDDLFYVDSLTDVVIELPGEGYDRIDLRNESDITEYTLPDNVEWLSGRTDIDITLNGNALDNDVVGQGTLNGGPGNDTVRGVFSDFEYEPGSLLLGGEGDDTLSGDKGNDTIDGGPGTDLAIYGQPWGSGLRAGDAYITQRDDGFVIFDARPSDTFHKGEDFVRNVEFFQFIDQTIAVEDLLDRSSLPPPPPLINLFDVDSGRIGGTALPGSTVVAERTTNFGNTVDDIGSTVADAQGNWMIDYDATLFDGGSFDAYAENDNGRSSSSTRFLFGSTGDPRTLNSNALVDDTIIGSDGNERLSGGRGNSTLIGGRGDDHYGFGLEDTIVEEPDGGIDTVFVSFSGYTLGANLENLTLRAGDGSSGNGNDADNVISGNDRRSRGSLFEVDEILNGGGGNDTLLGLRGNDTLDGGEGTDTATFSGNRADYSVKRDGSALRIVDQRGGDDDEGSDLVSSVEIFRFADGDILAEDILIQSGPTTGEVRVNSVLDDNQFDPDIVRLADGGHLVVWESRNQDGDSDGVYAQLFNPDGSRKGGEFLINQTTQSHQEEPEAAALPGGGFMVTWRSGQFGPDRDMGRSFDADGNPASDEFTVFDTRASLRSVAALDDGDVLVVRYRSDIAGGHMEGIVLAPDGTVVSPAFDIQVTGADFSSATVSKFADGTFLASWISRGATDGDNRVVARKLDALGQPSGPELILGDTGILDFGTVPTAELANGSFVAVWMKDGDPDFPVGRVFDSAGVPVSEEFTASDGAATGRGSLNVAALTNGGFVVAWTAVGRDGDGSGVYAQQFDANGATVGGNQLVNTTTEGNQLVEQYGPSIAQTALGEFTIVWSGNGPNDTDGVFLRHFAFDDPAAPNALDDTAETDQDLAVNIDVLANDTDANGDDLSVAALGSPQGGTVTINQDGTVTYMPNPGFSGPDSFTYTVSDGNGGTDTATVTVTVVSTNASPAAAADRAATAKDTPVTIAVLANDSDADGDDLAVTGASDPAGGSVVVNQDGTVTYTPDAGFRGQDSFTYTVSDGNGGSDTASVSIQVGPAPIRIVAGDGAVISIGGNGDVFGTNFDGGAAGRQDITFVPPPAGVQQALSLVPQGDAAPPLALDGDANDFDLDGSFGRGGDVLRFAGDAGGYTIAIQGVAAEISDGFSSYVLPIGTAGLVLVFDDGARTLAFDTGSGEVMLGSQTVTATPAQITAPDDGTQIPDIGNPATVSRAVLFENAQALLGGTFDVFGTNDGAETVGYVSGDLALDGSFARGGDEVSFEGPAATYSAYLSGTSLILLTPEGEVAAPVGVAGLTLDFAGDERTLAFDAGAGQVMIGDQAITATTAGAAQALMAEGFA